MKKLIITAIICLVGININAQQLVVTPEGLRDSENSERTFLVINAEGVTAKDLYDNAVRYITKSYKNPEEVIKGNIEGEYLKFNTYSYGVFNVKNGMAKVLCSMDYTIELSFKDGKVKFELVDLDIYDDNTRTYHVIFTGGRLEGYPIYAKNGKLRLPDTKAELESYFNTKISLLANALKDTGEDW